MFGPLGYTPSHRSLIGKILFLGFVFSLAVYPTLARKRQNRMEPPPGAFDSIPIPDFRFGTTLPGIVPADGTTPATSIIFVSPINGFTGTVSLSDPSPNRPHLYNDCPQHNHDGSGLAMVSCTSHVAGTYNVTVVGISDVITHSATATIRFGSSSPPEFSISSISLLGIAAGSNSHLKHNSVLPLRDLTDK